MAVSFLLAACLLAGMATSAHAAVIGQQGKRGKSATFQGECRYRIFGSSGYLFASVAPPAVRGANVKRRKRNEKTNVRYRAWLVNPLTSQTVTYSHWSGWLRVGQRERKTWSGVTSLSGDWRGQYALDLRIEWWRGGRLVGWRAHRIDSYKYFNQYNAGPFGPYRWCARV